MDLFNSGQGRRVQENMERNSKYNNIRGYNPFSNYNPKNSSGPIAAAIAAMFGIPLPDMSGIMSSASGALSGIKDWIMGSSSILGSKGATGWQGLPGLSSIYDIYNQERNYKSEQDAYNYQKELNDTQMYREDTAVQRRASDLQAAGLSKVLAAGSPASSSSLSAGDPPQRKYSLTEKLLTGLTIEKIKNEVDIQGIDKLQRSADIRIRNADADYKEYETNWLKSRNMVKVGDSTVGKNVASVMGLLKENIDIKGLNNIKYLKPKKFAGAFGKRR